MGEYSNGQSLPGLNKAYYGAKMTLLTIIGLIAIIHFLSKWMGQLGAWMENFGKEQEQREDFYTRKRREKELAKIRKALCNENSQEVTDDEYTKEVREEIEHLTKKEVHL